MEIQVRLSCILTFYTKNTKIVIMLIKSVDAKIVKDSRKKNTVEATINSQHAKCPSGASTGIYEAHTIDPKKAVSNIKKIVSEKITNEHLDLKKLDDMLIRLAGKNKSRLGANATTATSMAFCRAAAQDINKELFEYLAGVYGLGAGKYIMPMPLMNVINGGAHAKNNLAVQEFMILPIGSNSFKDAFEICSTVYAKLRQLIKEFYGDLNIGDEGGFAPPIKKTEHALNLLNEALKLTGYEHKVKYALDVAASQFFKKGKYHIDGKKLTAKELEQYYIHLVDTYPIVSIEDPFHEQDWNAFAGLTKKIGKKVQIVGDDLLTTNVGRIRTAISKKSCNSLLLKVNQIGTVSESMQASRLAKKHKWTVVVSHRSGETRDSFIADLAVGTGAEFIKSGAPYTPYRLSKYHRLIEIEDKTKSVYAGKILKF